MNHVCSMKIRQLYRLVEKGASKRFEKVAAMLRSSSMIKPYKNFTLLRQRSLRPKQAVANPTIFVQVHV